MSDKLGRRPTAEEINTIAELAEQSASAPIVRSGCKLCMSKHRKEAEELFAQTQNVSAVHRLLKSKGEEISYESTNTHLRRHYAKVQQQELVKNLTSELARWRSSNVDAESRTSTVLAILERRMIDIAAQIDGSGTQDTLKATDMLCKLATQILVLQNDLDSRRKHKDSVSHFFSQFQNLVKTHIDNTKNGEVKREIIDLINSIETQIGGMLPDGTSV
jgi:hypothetical protein